MLKKTILQQVIEKEEATAQLLPTLSKIGKTNAALQKQNIEANTKNLKGNNNKKCNKFLIIIQFSINHYSGFLSIYCNILFFGLTLDGFQFQQFHHY